MSELPRRCRRISRIYCRRKPYSCAWGGCGGVGLRPGLPFEPFVFPLPPTPGISHLSMLQRLRSLTRAGLNRIEAGLHPARRRRAAARVRARAGDPIVFVCLGNICRSPFAEFWMRAHASDPDRFTSAGFMAGGRSSPDTAIAVSRDFGLDLGVHVSRSISEIPLGRRLWVVMEHMHLRRLVRAGIKRDDVVFLGDLDPEPVERRAIVDPYGTSPEFFAATYQRIVRCLEAMEGCDGP